MLDTDEERVDAIVDAIEFPDQVSSEDEEEIEAEESLAEEGLDPQDVLSELFVAADRLMHDPLDHEGVLSLVDSARLAETLPLPYGFAPAVWKDVVSQAKHLREALEGEVDDDAVIEQATALRAPRCATSSDLSLAVLATLDHRFPLPVGALPEVSHDMGL